MYARQIKKRTAENRHFTLLPSYCSTFLPTSQNAHPYPQLIHN